MSFDGGFETGTTSQWFERRLLEASSPSRIQVVTSPVRHGRYAARFEVRPGDKVGGDNTYSSGASGERAELARKWDGQEKEGDRFFYALSFMLPSTWVQHEPGYRIPFQFHGVNDDLGGRSTYPPLALDFVAPDGKSNGQGSGGLWLELNGGDITNSKSGARSASEVLGGQVQTGVWHDLIIYVVWHRSKGEVKIWHKTAEQAAWSLRTDVTSRPTLQYITSPSLRVGKVYLRQGLYRLESSSRTDVIFLDSTRRGDTFGAVAAGL